MAIATFDIEISNVFDLDPGQDLLDYAPFDISVAATHVVGGEERHWYTRDASNRPGPNLSQSDAGELLSYLQGLQKAGHQLVAWNGLSFDLRCRFPLPTPSMPTRAMDRSGPSRR